SPARVASRLRSIRSRNGILGWERFSFLRIWAQSCDVRSVGVRALTVCSQPILAPRPHRLRHQSLSFSHLIPPPPPRKRILLVFDCLRVLVVEESRLLGSDGSIVRWSISDAQQNLVFFPPRPPNGQSES